MATQSEKQAEKQAAADAKAEVKAEQVEAKQASRPARRKPVSVAQRKADALAGTKAEAKADANAHARAEAQRAPTRGGEGVRAAKAEYQAQDKAAAKRADNPAEGDPGLTHQRRLVRAAQVEKAREDDVLWIVNPGGALHQVTRSHARQLFREVGWRRATAAEIAELDKRKGQQVSDDPIAEPWAPEPTEEGIGEAGLDG